MDLTRRLKSAATIFFLITIGLDSSHSRYHGRRHKRQHGAHLYLPESYVIPNGEGYEHEWGPWGSPSECSRSCGGGVAYQTRECINIGSDSVSRCIGGDKKYFSCNTQDCPESDPDFRSHQCSHFDTVPFEGVRYEWIPYVKAPNPCELNCMPRGERFYYRHKAKVIDGTRCNDESVDVCVDGQCQPVGCDLMLGSNAQEDKCRKCAGDGSSCKTVSGLLDTNDLQAGYNDLLLIPASATNIDIHEVAPSNNYLAIRNLTGDYYLNGNWRIDFPRPLSFAGSTWHYDRRPQGFAAPDHVTCMGPTTESIFLVLLYQDRNVGIHYEYSIPEGVHLPEKDTYSWTFTPFTECSATCGGGYKTRTVTCNSRITLDTVDDGLCDASIKPADTQQCGQEACPPRWTESEWSKCSTPCGDKGNQTRTVSCERVASTGLATKVADSVCLQQVGNKPATTQTCNIGLVCPEWHIGPWQPCDKLCGAGSQKRKIQCYRKIKNKIELLPNDECINEKPIDSKECILRPCEGVDWITSSWSGCSTCGLTVETRTVQCASKAGKIFNGTFCDGKKPEILRECAAPACKYQWYTSQWSNCSAKCGQGVQTRRIVCGIYKDETIQAASDLSLCTDEKPTDKKDCEVEEKCKGEWYSGPWSKCSKSCGGGKKTRKVLCIADDVAIAASNCDENAIEFSSEECNKSPCLEDETIPVDITSKPIEEDDEGEDWCDEDDEEPSASHDIEVVKFIPTDVTGISDGIEYDRTDHTESSLITDDLMLSDGTGFETDDTFEDTGSGDYEGSGFDVISTTETSTEITSFSDIFTTESDEPTESTSDSVESEITAITGISLGASPSDGATTEIASTTESDDLLSTTDFISTTSDDLLSTTDIVSTTETDYSSSEAVTESTTEIGSTTDYESTTESQSTTESEWTTLTEFSTSESTTDQSSTTEQSSTTDLSSSTDQSSTTDETSTSDSTTLISSTSEESTTEISTESSSDSSTLTESQTSPTTDVYSTDLTDSTTEEQTTDVSTTDISSTELSVGTTTADQSSTTEGDLTTDIFSTESSESTTFDQSNLSTDISSTSTEGDTSTVDTTSDSSSSEYSTETTTDSADVSTESSTPLDSTLSSTIDDSTETTVSGSRDSTDVSTTETSETETTVSDDEFGTTDSTLLPRISEDDEELWGSSTPNTLDAIISKEQKPRKCKPRPKLAVCLISEFGCCPDNTTVATGPFDEGCPVSETCKETKYGCCPDGLSPAHGKNNKGCPEPLCKESLFGCCESDGTTEAEGENEEGCPIVTTTTTTTTTLATTLPTETEVPCDDCTTPVPEATEPTETEPETEAPEKDCSFSEFGCCPDGLTEATGVNFHGCDIVDDRDCAKSFFGCCQDNRTSATGPDMLGCSPCLTEAFGCCRDGVTPAHGPNGEGCCLESTYGCCPDNINTARGPNLEDCGCQYSPYGCCPDNKTPARGYDYDGCGCEQTRNGCCLDKVTPAKGPKYEGCPCHTFQFGCCPDGITIPQGPHNYGCHCSQTEFKCCPDEKTPAQGPDGEGCTCATSKFGCCHDGVTSATGENFDGCEDIPKIPQEACSLPKEGGNCSTFMVKLFYDVGYGGCSRFWYTGCGGNDNRFETIEECKSTCENPEGRSACLLEKNHGPCTGYYPSFYYDKVRNVCSQFVYGGCLGNNNRFETVESCNEQCVVDTTSPPCEQPVEEGPCRGNFERWYYDKESDGCLPFRFGGCKGNKNNYASEHSCNYHCKKPGVHKKSCGLPKETGQCGGRLARWYYSENDTKCMPFYYSGCDGNKNSFISLADCEEQCPKVVAKDTCEKPSTVGDCQNYTARWYFDTREERCRQFYYGGCGGNDNNFETEQLCLARCDKKLAPTTTTEQPREPEPDREPEEPSKPFSSDDCFLDPDAGPCQNASARWYYNKQDGLCDLFAYGGCSGNANNFGEREECERQCGNVQNSCSLPPVYGQCSENETRWYHDHQTGQCVEFSYSGCAGNRNNFYTKLECINQCGSRTVTTKSPAIDERFGEPEGPSVCNLLLAQGNCTNYVLNYFFNVDTGNCEAFYYTGCDGNGNRFETQEQCERQCGQYRGVDVCSESRDEGPCDQWQTRYYYDQQQRQCKPFNYGGCGGSGNRFNSFEECESICITYQEPIDDTNKEICYLPAQIGKCVNGSDDYHKRWFYDDSRGTCMAFIYSGCAGNQNNFRSFESCQDFCFNNEQSNVIEHGELRTTKPDGCAAYIDECRALHCPYGVLRNYDTDGCERCECEDPCRGYICPGDSQCAVDIQDDGYDRTSTFAAVCRKVQKPGDCPVLANSSRCDRECYTDADCRGDYKCCVAGCAYVCTRRYEQEVTQAPSSHRHPPGSQKPGLEVRTKEETDVVQREGDVATLKCFATGYPLPTVTWRRGEIVINTDQGRFVLTATGDLQIVQVHRSDSGTYVCIASNDVGPSVEREVELSIADPVPGKAYIIGNVNSTQIVTLKQPTTIRCLAGGYPNPIVSWWHGGNLVPYNSEQFEVSRDYSLTIKNVELNNLGPYVCQAYSGNDKPVSIIVTLHAIGTVHTTKEDDREFLKYLLPAPQFPTTKKPDLKEIYRPQRPQRPIPPPVVVIPVVVPQEPSVSYEPVSARIILPSERSFIVGATFTLQCDIHGYPAPDVTWLKDGFEFVSGDRVQISPDKLNLVISRAELDDSGIYTCAAQNEFSSSRNEEQISIQETFIPTNCTDSPYFANCKLIVKGKYCSHQYYARFCCRSCTLAGQINYNI